MTLELMKKGRPVIHRNMNEDQTCNHVEATVVTGGKGVGPVAAEVPIQLRATSSKTSLISFEHSKKDCSQN